MNRTYLLVHGALRGAWLWQKVLTILHQSGAHALAIDLPGHGSRAETRTGVTMSVYIEDVMEFIRREDLRNLVLVGHSMSGIVISKVAEEMQERIRHLCYLAAVVPQDNDSLLELLTPERQETLKNMRGTSSEIFGSVDSLKAGYFTDLEGKEQEFYLRQLSPQPLAVFFEKIRFKRFPDIPIPKTYVLGLKDKSLPPDLTRGFAGRIGVTPLEINAGHDLMIAKAEEVTDILLKLP